MKKVVTFGELLIDFLTVSHSKEGRLQIPEIKQYPGGAPANVAVAVSILGGEASFIGQVGADNFGDYLRHCIEQFGVDTTALKIHETAATPLAFVMLDNSGERSFEFLRQNSADLVMTPADIELDVLSSADILHICSNTLTEKNITQTTKYVIEEARKSGSIISFDVNLRHNLWPQLKADAELVNEFVKMSDIIKISQEELDYLSNDEERWIADSLIAGCQLLVITDGAEAVRWFAPNGLSGVVKIPATEVVDTTAAGDSFTGGMLMAITKTEQPFGDKDKLNKIVSFATNCGRLAVTKAGAFTSLPTWQDAEQYWR